MNYKEQAIKEKNADNMLIQIRPLIMRASTLRLLELIHTANRELIERKLRGYDR